MRTELIVGTLDPIFDKAISNYTQEVVDGDRAALLKDAEGNVLPINMFFIRNSFIELLRPEYLFSASRELLDDVQNRFPVIQHRHIIPYIAVTCNGKIAVYSRTKKGTESQLHDKFSVGFGGHIELHECAYFGSDLAVDSVTYKKDSIDIVMSVVDGALRELDEELGIEEDNIVTHLVGATYEDSVARQYGMRDHALIVSTASPVDSRHLALVYRVEIKSTEKLVVEDQLNFVGWYTLEEIQEQYFSRMETWSQAILAQNSLDKIPFLI